MRARFNIDVKKAKNGRFHIVLKSANGNKFNHQYNTKAKAKQSAESLFSSMKVGHCRRMYE